MQRRPSLHPLSVPRPPATTAALSIAAGTFIIRYPAAIAETCRDMIHGCCGISLAVISISKCRGPGRCVYYALRTHPLPTPLSLSPSLSCPLYFLVVSPPALLLSLCESIDQSVSSPGVLGCTCDLCSANPSDCRHRARQK